MKKHLLFPLILLLSLLVSCQAPDSTSLAAATSTIQVVATTTPLPTAVPTSTPIAPPAEVPASAPAGYQLVWQDEFDGDDLNFENWQYEIGGWGFGNGEAQFYNERSENVRVENGLLVIEARFERYQESYYTSGKIFSKDLQEFQYGYIEARTKVPPGAGLWPAVWMLGYDYEAQFDEDGVYSSNWPDVGEIDIMEYIGREPDLVFGTAHGPGYSGALGLGRWNRQDYPIADEFHTYAIEWSYEGITWFYDGEDYFTLGRDDVGDREWVFDKPYYLILNLAVGGNFPGPPGLDTEFPANYYVDYVRVYQQEP
jgi:beta-glucanase (GH16 family)